MDNQDMQNLPPVQPDNTPESERQEARTRKRHIMMYGMVEGMLILIAVVIYLILK